MGASYFLDQSVQNLVSLMFGLGLGQTDTLIVVHIQVDIHSVAEYEVYRTHVGSIWKDSSEVGGLSSENRPILRDRLELDHCTLPVELEVHYRTQEGTHSVHHLGLISRNPRTSYSQDLPF